MTRLRWVRAWRARRALRAAATLDRIVDDQLPLLAGLSERSRRRIAAHLADLVGLASAYRAFASGLITKNQLAAHATGVIETLESATTSAPA